MKENVKELVQPLTTPLYCVQDIPSPLQIEASLPINEISQGDLRDCSGLVAPSTLFHGVKDYVLPSGMKGIQHRRQ